MSPGEVKRREVSRGESGDGGEGHTYLPLTWEVTVASGDTKEECVVVDEVIWGDDGVGWLRRRVKHLEDVF